MHENLPCDTVNDKAKGLQVRPGDLLQREGMHGHIWEGIPGFQQALDQVQEQRCQMKCSAGHSHW